ncbi:MAG: S1 RNA-binding domain-containing protein [Candidatus Moranbacteria bacterium]|jgi:small subunit ribosomal protein S1|nr:S1 RNA-binding domain-containing protein [Candidatus Moranbacteria bacterium]
MAKKNILDKLAEEVDKIKTTIKPKAVKAEKKTVTNKEEKAEKKTTVKKTATTEQEEDSSPMGKLLSENPIEIPEVGSIMEGTVIEASSSLVLLDLGAIGTGIVLGKESRDGMGLSKKLKPGDKISATLMDLENEDGYVELSIREASHEKSWDDLESKSDTEEVVKTKILDANKGGLMVELNGVKGFLPVSQLSSEHYPRVEDGNKNRILELLKAYVGQEFSVKIIDTNREDEKLIVSEKAAMSEKEREVISELKIDDIVEGEISGVVDFGAFIKFLPASKKSSKNDSDKLEGLVHISELAWQLINDPREVVKVGDKIKAKIIGIDDTRISLSIRALERDPWEEAATKYKIGEIHEGKVDKINHFGAFVYLDANIHGLAHISEFQETHPGKKMEDAIKVGEKYKWNILSIEPKNHRMGLILMDGKEGESKKEVKKEESVE